MTRDELIEGIRWFLIEANQHGYGAGSKARILNETDGSKSINYAKDSWIYRDNYFGGEPYGGQTTVFYKGKAVWIMVYYGQVFPEFNPKQIVPCLTAALRAAPVDFPVRGPVRFNGEEELIYHNLYGATDSIRQFHSREQISIGYGGAKKTVYEAVYAGGLIDQQ